MDPIQQPSYTFTYMQFSMIVTLVRSSKALIMRKAWGCRRARQGHVRQLRVTRFVEASLFESIFPRAAPSNAMGMGLSHSCSKFLMEVGTLNVEGRRAGTVFRGVERKK
jgi:hypothetical protein